MPITIRQAIDIVFILCSGEPRSTKNYTTHEGRVYNDVEFDMEDDYIELPQQGLKHFWYNEEEESFIAVGHDNRIRVTDYHDSNLFKEWLGICKEESVENG